MSQVWRFRAWHFDNKKLGALGTYAHKYGIHNVII